MSLTSKERWSAGNWNGYVAKGKTREDRISRLAEVPEELRDPVRRHVETVYKLKARNKR